MLAQRSQGAVASGPLTYCLPHDRLDVLQVLRCRGMDKCACLLRRAISASDEAICYQLVCTVHDVRFARVAFECLFLLPLLSSQLWGMMKFGLRIRYDETIF